MSQRSLLTHDRSESQFDAQAVRELATALTGPLLQPGDADYDRTRAVWNGMIDRRPGLIARCRNARDVAAAGTSLAARTSWYPCGAGITTPPVTPCATAG